ncbi:MAG TPA: hypothetical protein PKD67_07685 [Ignavibacteriaceae bacterium]|nr:hypothetical protein [Ignavibacteriaceae bacterium]
MKRLIKNINRYYTVTMRKAIIWSIINSIIFFSLLSFEQEYFTNTAKQNDAYISVAVQNILEQNYNERNIRHKSSEKLNFNEILFALSNIDLSSPNDFQTIFIVKSFGSIFISSQNNHSLRSPPLTF